MTKQINSFDDFIGTIFGIFEVDFRLGLVVLFFILYFFMAFIYSIYRILRVNFVFLKTTVKITYSCATEKVDMDSNNFHCFILAFTYNVDGVAYTGGEEKIYLSRCEANTLCKRFPVDSLQNARYDPDNPKDVIIDKWGSI